MMKKAVFFLLLLLCVSSQLSYGQLRSYSNEFLSLGIGARGLAMGNVQSASVGDVTAAYWNPAGLNKVENLQIGIQHAEWFAGIGKYDYVGLAAPIGYGERTIGVSLIRFGVDDIPNTLNVVDPAGNVDYDRLTTFSAADYGVLLSYAQELKNLRVGGNVKIIHRKVGDFATSWGFGLDLGAQYDVNDNVTLGATIRDLTTTPNLWSFNFTEEEKEILELTDNIVPSSSVELTGPRVILGGAWKNKLGKGERLSLLVAADIDFTFEERNTLVHSGFVSIDPHLGFELGYDELIYFRAGVNNIQRFLDDNDPTKEVLSLQPNVGLGLHFGIFTIDYALTGFSNLNSGLYSNVVSLKLDFEK